MATQFCLVVLGFRVINKLIDTLPSHGRGYALTARDRPADVRPSWQGCPSQERASGCSRRMVMRTRHGRPHLIWAWHTRQYVLLPFYVTDPNVPGFLSPIFVSAASFTDEGKWALPLSCSCHPPALGMQIPIYL